MDKSTNQKTKKKKLSLLQIKRYNFCIEYISQHFKFLKLLSKKDAETLISGFGEKSVEERQVIVDDLKIYFLNFFNYFALQFAKSNLKLDVFEDLINEYYLKISDILNDLVKNPKRFNSYLSYQSTIFKCGLVIIEKAVDDNLTFKRKSEINHRGKKVQLESLSDEIVDPSEPFEDRSLKNFNFDPKYGAFYKVLRCLSAKELKVLKMYFGLDGEKQQTFEEIGKHFNVTSQNVNTVLDRAIIKLKSEMHKAKITGDTTWYKDKLEHQTETETNPQKSKIVEFTGGDEEIVDYEKFSNQDSLSDSDYTYFKEIPSDSDNDIYNDTIISVVPDGFCAYGAGDEEIVDEERFTNTTMEDKTEVNINTEPVVVNTPQTSQEENENSIKKMAKISTKDKENKSTTLVDQMIKNGNAVKGGLNNLK